MRSRATHLLGSMFVYLNSLEGGHKNCLWLSSSHKIDILLVFKDTSSSYKYLHTQTLTREDLIYLFCRFGSCLREMNRAGEKKEKCLFILPVSRRTRYLMVRFFSKFEDNNGYESLKETIGWNQFNSDLESTF